MRINCITLHNFKSFEGTCRIDGLAENLQPGKPIILFGGLNGAGKTSIFEAILLCLYGRDNRTLFPSKGARREDYLGYVTAVTNNAAKSRSLRTEMWIELVFDQVEIGGVSQVLTVRRKWLVESANDAAREVAFEIAQGGKPIEFVGQDEFEEFVKNELIPYEVTQFFFFDGEKIQEFIKDEDRAFSESLEAVLGIGLYRTLSTDVNKVRQTLFSEYNRDKDVQSQLVNVDAARAQAELRITENRQNITQIEETIRELRERIEEIDKETYRITRVNAESREEAEAEKLQLNAEKLSLETQIFESIEDSLPFIIMRGLSQELLAQLEDEQQFAQTQAARQAAESRVSLITHRLFQGNEPEPPLTQGQKEFYRDRLRVILLDIFGTQPKPDVLMLHHLSQRDVEQIRQRITGTNGILNNLTKALNRLQEIEPRLRQMLRAEQRSLDDDTRELYKERGRLEEQITIREREISSLQSEISRLEGELVSLKRRRTELEEKATRTLQVYQQVEYCNKIRSALDVFSHRLRSRKVERLQQYTLEMWNQIARKQDQIHNITINPENNFSIDLYDADDRLIDKTKLSAGEKELLALSLIWGLTRLTNRSLPIVIDTPLGRLDSEHRAHIAERFFPRAGHQVILLSTDTEVVGEEYDAVAPFVCNHYLIEKDTARESSRVSEGYFSNHEH